MRDLDRYKQTLANCEFLSGGSNAYIITRWCDGKYEALVVDQRWSPINVLFRSTRYASTEDAISDLHRKTAESIEQRYDIVDGRMLARPKEETLADPNDDGDWHHVQPTPVESEDTRGFTSKEPNAEDGQREMIADAFLASGAADGSRDEDAVVGGKELKKPKKGKKKMGRENTMVEAPEPDSEKGGKAEVSSGWGIWGSWASGKEEKKEWAQGISEPVEEIQDPIAVPKPEPIPTEEKSVKEVAVEILTPTEEPGPVPIPADENSVGEAVVGDSAPVVGPEPESVAVKEEFWSTWGRTSSKTVKKKVKKGISEETTAPVEKEQEAVAEPDPVLKSDPVPAEESIWSTWGAPSKKDKKNKKRVVVEKSPAPAEEKEEAVAGPNPVFGSEPIPAEESIWNTWGASSKKDKKNKKGVVVGEASVLVGETREAVVVSDATFEPVPVLAEAPREDTWAIPSKKGKKNKKRIVEELPPPTEEDKGAVADPKPDFGPEPPPPAEEEQGAVAGSKPIFGPEPVPAEVSCEGTWAFPSKKDKKSKRRTVEESPPPAEGEQEAVAGRKPVFGPEPVPVEESIWNTWAVSSKKDKKSKKGGCEDVVETLDFAPVGEPIATKNDGWGEWGTLRSEKDNEKGTEEGIVETLTSATVDEPKIAEDASWSEWGTLPSKKGKNKGKGKNIVEALDSAPVDEPTVAEDDGWGPLPTKKKKNKGKGKDVVETPASALVKEPTVAESDDWSGWGTLLSKKEKQREEGKDIVEAPDSTLVDEPTIAEDDGWGPLPTKRKKKKGKGVNIVETLDFAPMGEPTVVRNTSWSCGEGTPCLEKKGGKIAEEGSEENGKNLETKGNEDDVWSFWGASKKTRKKSVSIQVDEVPAATTFEEVVLLPCEEPAIEPAAAESQPQVGAGDVSTNGPSLQTEQTTLRPASTLLAATSPAPPQESREKVLALLKISGDPSGYSGSVLVTLETPVSQASIVRHAAAHVPASLHRTDGRGKVRSIVLDGCETELCVDDSGLGRALSMVLRKGDIPTLLVELGLADGRD
ncbi:hypothetical protein GP486_003055 [Trichoglossum hirsutum]|uniref:Uncharacterized protein n=1 Tax=Trichoglossum hirsutum TaxID=265104 RepID=A0A9P8RR44_9PEZI|nr:hypothetical protein GP486_003055 [Trichoglossum hirsutum]